MAKLECTVRGTLSELIRVIHEELLNGSATATYEDGSDFTLGNAQCAVRVYERYSAMGGNRVSQNITLFGGDGEYHMSAITSGGSQAMLFKINTFGEEAFLEKLEEAVRPFRV